jgi:hypothetical protein
LSEGLYGRNFSRAASPTQKPSCYADPNVYSETDDECRACPCRTSCRYQVEEKLTNASRAYNRPGTSWAHAQPTATAPAPTTRVITPGTAVATTAGTTPPAATAAAGGTYTTPRVPATPSPMPAVHTPYGSNRPVYVSPFPTITPVPAPSINVPMPPDNASRVALPSFKEAVTRNAVLTVCEALAREVVHLCASIPRASYSDLFTPKK